MAENLTFPPEAADRLWRLQGRRARVDVGRAGPLEGLQCRQAELREARKVQTWQPMIPGRCPNNKGGTCHVRKGWIYE